MGRFVRRNVEIHLLERSPVIRAGYERPSLADCPFEPSAELECDIVDQTGRPCQSPAKGTRLQNTIHTHVYLSRAFCHQKMLS